MVDTKVFTDMFGELDKKTEAKIRKLLGNAKVITQQQAKILQSIIDDALRSVGKITTAEQAAIYATVNVFNDTNALEKLIPYQNNIGKMFQFGIKFTNKTPSATVKQLEEGVKQSTQRFIVNMGEDLKRSAGQIVSNGIKSQTPTNEIVNQLKKELDITRARANSIARTETMRAAHAGSYAQAIRDGKNYYVIDSRAEACKICKRKFTDEVFPIYDPGPMPPAHPNCACIPIYFNNIEDAQRWAGKISRDIAKQVAAIEKDGKIIKPDGTGTEVNKIKPNERIKN